MKFETTWKTKGDILEHRLLFIDKNELDQAEKFLQEAAQANLVSI